MTTILAEVGSRLPKIHQAICLLGIVLCWARWFRMLSLSLIVLESRADNTLRGNECVRPLR
jgi:hypothetical protein